MCSCLSIVSDSDESIVKRRHEGAPKAGKRTSNEREAEIKQEHSAAMEEAARLPPAG